LDQGGAPRAPRAGASARPQPWGGPAGARRPSATTRHRSVRPTRPRNRCSGVPSSSPVNCPAPGRRV